MQISQPQQNEAKRRRKLARMEPLAKLPVFWDLDHRDVLIAGGSEAAAWKAELMAACGARVHVYAEELSDVMETLISGDARFIYHAAEWPHAPMPKFTLAIGDCEEEAEALAFYNAARICGVPVNVIDNPPYCQFQFGSIVNRSPVVISISTDGAAPILGQAIRRRIETLLPPALKGWAELAQKIRPAVTGALAMGAPRRIFWERFVDRAFRGNTLPSAADEESLRASISKISSLGESLAGGVTYVGAGPGEAEMLTLKAVRALQSADVILYDEGVTAEVLELARREAKRLFVADFADDLADRSEMAISLARSGKRVVRLVRGDGSKSRALEWEMTHIRRYGIALNVVAGVAAELHPVDGQLEDVFRSEAQQTC